MAWGESRVEFCDDDGRWRHLPASWTDIEEREPFVVVAGGRAHFRLEDLRRLAELIEQLGAEE